MQIAQVTIGLEIRRQIEVLPVLPQIIDHQTALPLVEEDAETNKSFFWLVGNLSQRFGCAGGFMFIAPEEYQPSFWKRLFG